MTMPTFAVPTHVPAELVRDVDPFALPGGERDAHLAWRRVQDDMPDIYFTPHYGGYWMLNRANLLDAVWPDHERFCSSGGISVPPMPEGLPPQLPIVADPPEHRFYRQPLAVALSPKRVQALGQDARALAIELIEGFRAKGECEFVEDFAKHLPMIIFLRLVDLPTTDREWLIQRAEVSTRSSDLAKRGQAFMDVLGYLDSWVRKRAANPGDDLISDITRVKVDGRPITHEEALGECALALFGGLDTVAGTMGFFARFLAENPAHRQQLIDDPSLIPAAVEELLRRYSIPMVARTVTRDLTLGGVAMKTGDHVILETCMHGLDERAWPDALKVDFRRSVADHMAFGKGVHKCPGANLARAELRIFLEEWLQRIPHFTIKPGEHAVTANGAVMGVIRLPLAWTL